MQQDYIFFKRIGLLVTTCLLLAVYSYSQSLQDFIVTKRIISAEDGFVSREVYCSLQDKDGFMWFGTQNGLNRFDGKNFLLFTTQQGLRKNKVVQIAVDDANRLYIQYSSRYSARIAGKEVDVMDLGTHTVKKLSETFPNMPFQENDILWLSNNGTGEIVFLTALPYRTWTYTTKNGFRQTYEVREKMQEGDSAKLHRMYMGQHSFYQGGQLLLNLNLKEYYFISTDTAFKLSSASHVLTASEKNDVLFLSNGSINNLKNEQVAFNPVLNKNWREVHGIIGKQAAVLFSPTDGMVLWDKKRTIELFGKNELPGFMTVYSCSVDASGNYWICTSHGVIVVTIHTNRFQQYFTKNDFNRGFNNSTRGIYEDEAGNIFANIDIMVCKRDKDGSIKSSSASRLTYPLLNYKNNLLVGASIFYSYNESNNELMDILPHNTFMDTIRKSREMWSLFQVDENKIFAGYTDNILICDMKKQEYHSAKFTSPAFPKPELTYRFFRISNNEIGAASDSGLYILNTEGTVIDYYGTSADASHKLPFSDIQDAYYEGNNIFWLATNGQGLYRWDRNDNSFKQYSVTDGLTSNVLYRMEADNYNNLWISSDNGLVRFNTKTYATNKYTIKDGISDNEFNRISSFKAKDGRLFFGGLNGVNAFYPRDFMEDSLIFNVPLRVVSYNLFEGAQNKIVNNTEQLLGANQIVLEPGDKFFTLEFQLLDFAPPEQHRYAYKIDGIDNGWNYIAENSVRISGLNYGNYTLHVKGQNLDNTWSASELIIPLIVLKPFYRQTWFIILASIICLLLGYGFYWWRTYTLRKEKKFLEQTVGRRTSELREALAGKEMLLKEIHHRVKNNLQVISALLEMQGARTDDEKTKAAITDSQNRVLSIAFLHQNLYQHDDIKSVEMQSFVTELTQHIAHVFAGQASKVDVVNNIDKIFLDIDTAVPLGLIINELLTNSYKYAFVNRNSGVIRIDLQQNGEGSYKFSYADNGIGLPVDFDIQKSNSLGMKLVRSLCKQLSGTLTYTNHNGSTFTFTVQNLETRSKTP